MSTIKSLTQKAKQGSLMSQFQLYEDYKKGKSVEQDEGLSEKYFSLLTRTIKEQRICLNSLKLKDFRRFRDLKLDFDKRMTVIIGDNGAGKTSIAEAIAKAFSWVNNNLEKDDVNGKPVIPSDINVNSRDYSEIECEFILSKDNKFEGSLARTISGYSGNHTSDVNLLKRLGAIYRHVAMDKHISLPFLAFYSVERSDRNLPMNVPEKASDVVAYDRYIALKNALEGSGRLEDFSVQYIELVNLAEGKISKGINDLKAQIDTLQNTLNDVYQGNIPAEGNPFAEKLREKKAELAQLEKESPNSASRRHLDAVNRAIETLVPDVKNLHVDRSSGKPQILVENFGNLVNIAQLSKGQQMLTALTGDLAMRMTRLNPEANGDPLNGHGIVVIDEIELHLHPRWQQEILIGLQETFPNLQFIVTTHSPQVLSTVDYKCIRKISLDDSGEPIIVTPNFQTKGVTSADILARIMGTNSVPEKLKEANWLTEFSRYVKEGDTAARDKVFEEIKRHFGVQHPVVADCESRIRIVEMNARLNARKSKDEE